MKKMQGDETSSAETTGRHVADGRVVMRGLDWAQFETILAIRGDRAGLRLAYLDGDLEIMSPSDVHERIKTLLSRLLETYAEEAGIRFDGYGSLTMKRPELERAAEPDECYVLGEQRGEVKPDLVIEVTWASGGIDKRRLYADLGVKEYWEWRAGKIEILVLRGSTYEHADRSELLPGLDLALLMQFLESDDQTAAVRTYRKALRAGSL